MYRLQSNSNVFIEQNTFKCYNKEAMFTARIIECILPFLNNYLIIPRNQIFIIKKTKGFRGLYDFSTVFISPSMDLLDVIKTVCHECIHVDQHMTHRFYPIDLYGLSFDNSIYTVFDFLDHDNKPWELEAIEGEEKLSDEIMKWLKLEANGENTNVKKLSSVSVASI